MTTIGITGTIGAGKGTIVDYLKTKGFVHYSAREFLLKEVSKRGLDPVRSNIALVANDLRKAHFPGYIIGELLNEAQTAGKDAVIESIRATGELDLLRQNAKNFYLLAIDADIKLRYERIVKRGSSTDHVSFEKFVEDENKELAATEAWNMNIRACISKADFVLNNDGDFDALEGEIDQILAQIKDKTV